MHLEVHCRGRGESMYDLSGLYYQMKSDGMVFGIVGLLFLICSRFWIMEKNTKDLLVGILCSFLCVCSLGCHAYVINNLKVSVHEGRLR